MLKGSKVIGQIARSYCVYPITISNWKKEFIEKAFRDIYVEERQAFVDGKHSRHGLEQVIFIRKEN